MPGVGKIMTAMRPPGAKAEPGGGTMWERLRLWRENRKLARLVFTETDWEEAIAGWAPAARYQGREREQLRDNALRFLLRKPVVSGGGFAVTDAMRLRIGIMAAVLIQGLDLDWFQGWYRVILYEGAFVPGHDREDDNGIVHTGRHALSGEAWLQGPVILSWEDVLAAGEGDNVVLHELAHKLDMLTGDANGFPPLHRDMDTKAWHDSFTAAYEDLARLVEQGAEWPVDEYALESPGEFFAVATEAFFECPARLKAFWPDIYHHLAAFYRQSPLDREINDSMMG